MRTDARSLDVPPSRRPSTHERGTIAAVHAWLRAEHLSAHDVVDLALEPEQRARTQRARRTRRGDDLGTYPDALLAVATRAGPSRTVAIELISRKYSDAMVLKKGALLARFDEVVFFGDTPHTAARVERLLGESCRCI